MNSSETVYTVKEIEAATGVKAGTIRSRAKRLGLHPSGGGYTLTEVKQLIKRPSVHRTKFSQRKADALRSMLKNDGAL